MIDIILFIYILALGSVIGSFLNVLIYRFPKNISVVKGYSHCPDCDNRLVGKDLVPIFSFLFLKGKCRYCKKPISYRYPAIEALTAILFAISYLRFGMSLEFAINALLLSDLIVIAMIDIDTMEILYRTNIFILVLGIVALVFGINSLTLMDCIIGMLIVSVPLFVVGYVTGGFGGGDVWLMGAAGFLLGSKATVVAVLIGIIAGGIFGSILLYSKKKDKKAEMPFGPWLAIGIYIASLYGTQIADWYLSTLG